MTKSLLEQLPHIVAEGRRQAERILESLDSRNRGGLLTREWVMPAKDVKARDWLRVQDQARARADYAPPHPGGGLLWNVDAASANPTRPDPTRPDPTRPDPTLR